MLGQRKRRMRLRFDKRHVQEAGIIFPVKRMPLKFLPGRHLLGLAGEGMRFLRSRSYEPLEDNPRDIDKFSPPHALTVTEWERETQTEILLLVDVSASMAYPPKSRLRNAVVLQLVYSLWRAGDRVRTVLFADDIVQEIREPNLRAQLERVQEAVNGLSLYQGTDINGILGSYRMHYQSGRLSPVFVVSDFVSSVTSGEVRSERLSDNTIRHMRPDLIPVVISSRLSEETQGYGKVWDPERNREGIVLMSRARRAYCNKMERKRVRDLARELRKAGLDHIVISYEREVYPNLVQLARTREKRRR